MIDKDKRYLGGWWVWVTGLILLSVTVFWVANAVGLIGQTAVQREVFERSYQRQAGDAAKLSTFEAERAAIQSQLRRSDISPAQRADYEAQLAAINIQIQAIEASQ